MKNQLNGKIIINIIIILVMIKPLKQIQYYSLAWNNKGNGII